MDKLARESRKKKVVWLCNFANKEIANILGSKKEFFAAPWITELIEIFRHRNDIEISIISPNYFENEERRFTLGNINVYLFKYRFRFLPHKAYNLSYNYSIAHNSILSIIDEVKPDLINLHGSENPFYSIAALRLMNKYPVLITIQGFVSLSSKGSNPISNYIRWNRIRIEKKINEKAKFFAVSSDDASEYLKVLNQHATFFKSYYPTIKPNVTADDFPNKKFDIAFFARITRNKGIEDTLLAIKSLKNKYPKIKAVIIGGGSSSYVKSIASMIESLGLSDNIDFAGFQSTQQAAFNLVAQAKVSVLPTYFDALPGSIREAMYMKVPVVAYGVGGIPSLNSDEECIALVERKNILKLVETIDIVLRNTEYAEKLVKNAFKLITSRYDNDKIYDNLINIYDKVIHASYGQNS